MSLYICKVSCLLFKLFLLQGTWKEQLKQKFRNGRRCDGNGKKREMECENDCNAANSEELPMSKKQRIMNKPGIGITSTGNLYLQYTYIVRYSFVHIYIYIVVPDMTEEAVINYDVLVRELAEEERKDNPKNSKIKKLMKKTFDGRRKWINDDMPSVIEVVELFPSFKISSWVS